MPRSKRSKDEAVTTRGRRTGKATVATPRSRAAAAGPRGGRPSQGPGKGQGNLVIVESPAKARTLATFLGRGYAVQASVGHVRDLPKSRLGVDIERDFAPTYVVPKEKEPVVRRLREAAQKAQTVYLATDPDREGEAIAWHLVEAAGLQGRPHWRVAFHEVTPYAVRRAFQEPRQVDIRLVNAQQARRVLDRLLGYKLSPLLWQKVRRGLSAGRVQSVALRMVVERERAVQDFVPQEYWSIEAELARMGDAAGETFRAHLEGLLADGKVDKLEIPDAAASQQLVATLRRCRYRVADVRTRSQARRPAPPFITSTLQQEASRRLGFRARRTMALAQQLYEGLPLGGGASVGLITYMRTDSTAVSAGAQDEARRFIRQRFSLDHVPPAPRRFRKVKGAQEAHEAVRPTSVFRTPESLARSLSRDQLRLYRLIWQRFVASQMADARYDVTTADIDALPPADDPAGAGYRLRATARQLRFAGFLDLYGGTTDDDEQEQQPLPDLVHGEPLRLVQLYPEQHFTEPPPRYTEASLVKALEENGIGRPSTYAPILGTIQDRGYVEREGRSLRPTELGFVVNDLLMEHFSGLIDVGFTAEMEGELDEIARGVREWVPVVRQLYNPLEEALEVASQAPAAREETGEACDLCGRPMVVRWGRFGKFLACSGYPECRNSRPLEEESAETDEVCDLCGSPMQVKRGRYGVFLACARYPECKGTKKVVKKIGVACPRCGGDLVEKRAGRGRRRTFYGCRNYPRCDFASWVRPLPEVCPRCSGMLVVAPRRRARCTACEWSGERREPEPVQA